MKKIAMSVAAATMLLGGLAGCGTDNQATDMGANNYQGARAQDMRDGGAVTGRHQGEGPITDMMTRDDRRGTTGLGTNRAGRTGDGGLYGGQGRTGQTGQGLFDGTATDRGLFNGRAGQTGQGLTGQGLDTGQGRAGGFFGLERDGARQSRTHLNNYPTRETNQGGVHYGATGRDARGTADGLFGTRGAQGIRGQGATDERAGLTGGNRSGMVDEDGILRGRARGGTGALGTTPGHNRQGQGAMNLEGRDRGTAGQTGRYGTAEPGNRTGVNRAQQRTDNQINYHKDYDGKTVRRMVDRIEDVEGVREARVIVHNDDVVIGITANDDVNDVKKDVERKAKRLADGKNVRVVTDNDAVGRIRTMDNQLRAGTAFEEIGATFTDMLRDLGRAAGRPFERSR
ncbi:YhcN/YlaJ family sporulation lipoprotein [Halalkalibacter krulwichiae]|uniref:Sporulation lipoprotein YhcN/YlaJ (Spore_YhcN_YlaJ) n=1 Tax=Halalkalibacter krulwichiae TaxID=199441 RepID=A0A1X9MAM2_9BACI|nr:YhcN/YlaJ family sporulation lipoprotein [Halalkalibacter krulwichiae]ARK29203.1 Sporulation lipoprotein YhcN/YlaJ (Spore_YhcN_YlaJ) [Halalkalibacter krulwichiae]